MKSPLRWAGSKISQIAQIQPFLVGNRLIEPFVGGGSVFLNTGFSQVHINDVNPHVYMLWNVLTHDGANALQEAKQLAAWVTDEARYNQLRDNFNSGNFNTRSKAIFFLVLNRTCFNGLCRFNKKGMFNVPWGQKEVPYFPEEEINEFIKSGLKPVVTNVDFSVVMDIAKEGDVVFCDPPYEPMPKVTGFTNYSGHSFKWGDQKRLAGKAKELQARGVRTVITNSSAPRVVELYEHLGFDVHDLVARRSIAAAADKRGNVNDIIAVVKP